MSFIVATNIVASTPPECQLTGMLTARLKRPLLDLDAALMYKMKSFPSNILALCLLHYAHCNMQIAPVVKCTYCYITFLFVALLLIDSLTSLSLLDFVEIV